MLISIDAQPQWSQRDRVLTIWKYQFLCDLTLWAHEFPPKARFIFAYKKLLTFSVLSRPHPIDPTASFGASYKMKFNFCVCFIWDHNSRKFFGVIWFTIRHFESIQFHLFYFIDFYLYGTKKTHFMEWKGKYGLKLAK